jgi:Zn-dependent protease
MYSENAAPSSSGKVGPMVLLAKLAPKLLPIMTKFAAAMPKVFKGLLSFKAVGVVASAGMYTYIMTWQMGISITAFILVHEYGHLWAMKRCGLKTNGVYLIPGFGGAAVSEEGFKSCRNEVFIALMGPLVGLLFIVPVLVVYYPTGNPMFAAIASAMAVINLINLFPINPLDGGRVVKGLLHSFHGAIGFYFSLISFVVAVILSVNFGMSLCAYIAVIGLVETFTNYGLLDHMRRFKRSFMRLMMLTAIFWGFQLDITSYFNLLLAWLLVVMAGTVLVVQLLCQAREEYGNALFAPLALIADVFAGAKEFFSIRPWQLKRVDGMESMSRPLILVYSVAYVITILIMTSIIWYANQLPGCELAMQMLK